MPRRLLQAVIVFLLLASAAPAVAANKRYVRSVENYRMPDVVLINQDGERVRFKSLMEMDKPVIVDFIYGTCTTICPVLSAGYANLQRKLGEDSEQVQLVSISIDPENDTPAVMKEYLERYRARPGWDFLSGSRQDIYRVMEAFDAFFRDKMNHQPLTFIRSSPDGSEWVRLYGLISGRDFMEEFQKVEEQ